MILTNLILVAGALGSGSLTIDSKPKVEWKGPERFFGEGDYVVHVVLTVPEEAEAIPAWLMTPAAFTVNGKPLLDRPDTKLKLGWSGTVNMDMNLGPLIAKSGYDGKDFKLEYAMEYLGGEGKEVRVMQAADKGLDFMKIPVEELSKYHVIMSTNQGDMEMEFWPDVAPNHVRNFLDLSYTGFYDGKIFHRVIPGFMIQGGDPTGTGTGNGPRMLKAEFNAKKHVPGVLSMARSADVNSASCQFFVMHKANPGLDGQYSGFGQLVRGQEVVDKIVNVKKNTQDRPFDAQTIKKCTVVKTAGK